MKIEHEQQMTRNILKMFLYETYLNASRGIKIGTDKFVFALSVSLFFKEEVDLFYKNNSFEDAKIDLNIKRLNNLSYTEIISEVCNWYIGEVDLTKFKLQNQKPS